MKHATSSQNKDWLEKLAKTGVRVRSIENAPKIRENEQWLWATFNILSGRRFFNDKGPQAILFSEIESYSRLYGITEPATKAFLTDVVIALDSVYMREYEKKRAQQTRKEQAKAKTKRGVGRG